LWGSLLFFFGSYYLLWAQFNVKFSPEEVMARAAQVKRGRVVVMVVVL